MRKLILLALILAILPIILLVGCKKQRSTVPLTKQIDKEVNTIPETRLCTSVFDVVADEQSNAHANSVWAGRNWEVFGDSESNKYEALTSQITEDMFDSITGHLCAELGSYTYSDKTLPFTVTSDSGTYWMAAKSYHKFYYWCNDEYTIGWGLFEKDNPGYAYLYIEYHKSK